MEGKSLWCCFYLEKLLGWKINAKRQIWITDYKDLFYSLLLYGNKNWPFPELYRTGWFVNDQDTISQNICQFLERYIVSQLQPEFIESFSSTSILTWLLPSLSLESGRGFKTNSHETISKQNKVYNKALHWKAELKRLWEVQRRMTKEYTTFNL